MIQIIFYVPETHLETVKSAMFAQGAGNIGNYDQCAWQTLGQGQFRPQSDADPYVGQTGKVEEVAEYKVEMVCNNNNLKDVLTALHSAHPYEEPAFSYWPVNSGMGQST